MDDVKRIKEWLSREETRRVLHDTIRGSRIKGLVEFSRAVHAEMEALMSVARAGTRGLIDSTLYCTTYPCHNCAKHIVAAGVSRLVYLEPYEKSLARKLHSDSINDPLEENPNGKVVFDLYGGASPSRYEDFFTMSLGNLRKQDGRYLDRDRKRTSVLPIGAQSPLRLMQQLDKAIELEKRIRSARSLPGDCEMREEEKDGERSETPSSRAVLDSGQGVYLSEGNGAVCPDQSGE